MKKINAFNFTNRVHVLYIIDFRQAKCLTYFYNRIWKFRTWVPNSLRAPFPSGLSLTPLNTFELKRGTVFDSWWLRWTLFVQFPDIIFKRWQFTCVYIVLIYWRLLISGHLVPITLVPIPNSLVRHLQESSWWERNFKFKGNNNV